MSVENPQTNQRGYGVVDAIEAHDLKWGEMFLHMQEAALHERQVLPSEELIAIGKVCVDNPEVARMSVA